MHACCVTDLRAVEEEADHEDGAPLRPPEIGDAEVERAEGDREADEVGAHDEQPLADVALPGLCARYELIADLTGEEGADQPAQLEA